MVEKKDLTGSLSGKIENVYCDKCGGLISGVYVGDVKECTCEENVIKIPPVVYCNICGKIKSGGTNISNQQCHCESQGHYIHVEEQWEYDKIVCKVGEIKEVANEMGKEGWRCIGALSYIMTKPGDQQPKIDKMEDVLLLFERRVI